MQIICDDPDFARFLLGPHQLLQKYSSQHQLIIPPKLCGELFSGRALYVGNDQRFPFWSCLCAVGSAARSHIELLADYVRQSKADIPDRLIIAAREGAGFIGYKNRNWVAEKGNLHITVLLKPFAKLTAVNSGFTVLSSVALVKAVSHFIDKTHAPGIRWVNDVLVDDKKIGGVLCRTQMQGETVETALVGLGLNVLTKPYVAADIFVPAVTHLAAYSHVAPEACFKQLMIYLAKNYQRYVQGDYKKLWQEYIACSQVIGRRVDVYSDPYQGPPKHLLSGVVETIGENLELYFEGNAQPVFHGRLVLC